MYTLKVVPYLDEYNKEYKQIITINSLPNGELLNYVKKVNLPDFLLLKKTTVVVHLSVAVMYYVI